MRKKCLFAIAAAIEGAPVLLIVALALSAVGDFAQPDNQTNWGEEENTKK